MSRLSKLFCGITLITVPAIAYRGYFLPTILPGWKEPDFTSLQFSMFRAGNAFAGVLVILNLVAQLPADHSSLSKFLNPGIRIGFPLSPARRGRTSLNQCVFILYIGIGWLIILIIVLSVGLVKSHSVFKKHVI